MKNRFLKRSALIGIWLSIFLMPRLVLGWTIPSQISGSGVNLNPSVSINTSGTAVAVWTHDASPDTLIQASVYSSQTWSTSSIISGVGININPSVAIDGSGNIIAIWEQITEEGHLIKATSLAAGGVWETPITISVDAQNISPKIVINASGNALAAWVNQIDNTVEVATLTFGGLWSPPIKISSPEGTKGNVKAGIDSAGNGYIVWENFDTHKIFASHSTGNIWGLPVQLTNSGVNVEPTLSVSENGNAIAAWTNIDLFEIHATTFSNGSWSLTPLIISSTSSSKPIAASYASNGFVAWRNQDSGHIQASNLHYGSWTVPPFELSPQHYNESPNIAFNANGTATIVWPNLYSSEIEAIKISDGHVPSFPVQTISNGNSNLSPTIAAAGTTTIVVWTSNHGSNTVIQANID